MLILGHGSAWATLLFVDGNNAHPQAPFTNWTTAAASIQDAVDAAMAGDEIVVTNGIYSTGGRAIDGTMTNRVAVDKPLTLRSVNGPQFTVIQGHQLPGATNGDGAIRCVYLKTGAALSGFTLAGGATQVTNDYPTYQWSGGGGVWCDTTNGALVSNCVLTGNLAYIGGGAFGARLVGCTLNRNRADLGGGGACGSSLETCTLEANWAQYSGGGVAGGSLTNCTLHANSAGSGGGASYCTLNNCALRGNSALSAGYVDWDIVGGGGASYSTLNNCTLSGNAAFYGGGAFNGTLNNCIAYFNTAPTGSNYYESTLNHCCTAPQPDTGLGNISGDPLLASPSHLSAASPCRGAGSATHASGTDIDGELWASPPAIGCDEYHAAALTGSLSVGVEAAFTTVATGFAVPLRAWIEGQVNSTLSYCCTSPLPRNGIGNITSPPLFMDQPGGNLRLQPNSPCINPGLNAWVPTDTDIDGSRRIVGATVDIGAYEFQAPASRLSYAWLQQYRLPTDGSADNSDPDGDGLNNWQEWRCGTDPTNALSVLRLLAPVSESTNVIVTWQSAAGVSYFLERSTNLTIQAFSPVTTDIVGQAGATTCTDTNAIGPGPWFYRVGVGD